MTISDALAMQMTISERTMDTQTRFAH